MNTLRTALLLGFLASPLVARAHGGSYSYLDLALDETGITGTLDLPVNEAERAVNVDADRDGRTTPGEIASAGGALGDWMIDAVRLVADGATCRGTADNAELRPNAVVAIRVRWTCPTPPLRVFVATRFAASLGDGHSIFTRVHKGELAKQALLDDRTSATSFDLGTPPTALAVAGKFVVLGLEHIVTGYDHLLFLFSLLLLGTTLRRIVVVATSFTLAHSVTLSLAALGIVVLPSRFVEVAIAGSIAWVAVENLALAAPVPPGSNEPWLLRHRPFLTFAFGLIHGFGFAGLLAELGLPEGNRAVALACFNVGVELGQLAVLVAVTPLLARVSKRAWWRPSGVRSVSLVVLVAAVYWIVQRWGGTGE